jgi:hypothetical protein
MSRHAVDTVEEAICALRASGLEIIAIQNGWILREMDQNGSYQELVCDSHRDLIERANHLQLIRLGLAPEAAESNNGSWLASASRSSGRRLCQSTLVSWAARSRDTTEAGK